MRRPPNDCRRLTKICGDAHIVKQANDVDPHGLPNSLLLQLDDGMHGLSAQASLDPRKLADRPGSSGRQHLSYAYLSMMLTRGLADEPEFSKWNLNVRANMAFLTISLYLRGASRVADSQR